MIVANMKNEKTGRFHPIIFQCHPLPGGLEIGNFVRYKSKGHHTLGFDTEKESLEECDNIIKKLDSSKLYLKETFLWNGEGVPAKVTFFQ
jgi:hypothetical protein